VPKGGKNVSIHTRVARISAVVALVVLLAPATAAAQYTAARKIGRGLSNFTCGWLAIPGEVVQTGRERGYGWGFTLGFVEGIGMAFVRTAVGAYESISAPFPLPEGFRPIVRPEYPWDYFDQPARRAP
jgi:putative exosortase-associated protein (TIGR04073 family)